MPALLPQGAHALIAWPDGRPWDRPVCGERFLSLRTEDLSGDEEQIASAAFVTSFATLGVTLLAYFRLFPPEHRLAPATLAGG